MAPPILTLKDIDLTFGGTPLLEGAQLIVEPGARLCLVGRNGSGKSTLLKIAAGLIEADDGERFVKPGTTLRYLSQDPDLSGFADVRAYINSGLEGADDEARIPYLIDALGLGGAASPSHLSGGEARRAALACALAPQPGILMLDEPTNHLDLQIIEWLEGELASFPGALILISHDRKFLQTLTRQTLWVDRGKTRLLEKGFGHFEDWRDTTLEQEALDLHKLGRQIAREQHWIVHGVSGRRKRNMRRVKELAGLRAQKSQARAPIGKANISAAQGATSGKIVAKLASVSKSFGERKIIDDIDLRIARGERIGIIGPNGSGKTTLLRLIMGELEADEGQIELGTNITPLVLDQNRAGLDPNTRLKDALTGGSGDSVMVGNTQKHVIGYMKDFLFAPEQQRTPLHALSGGERARVELARGLCLPSNLLVLDEPTNDLDLETLDLLQELIADYQGTVILVSHDRDFLDRTVTKTVAFAGKGKWRVYAGGYSDMLAQRKKNHENRQTGQARKPSGNSKTQPSTPAQKTIKLSYKHKYALENLPKTMAALEAEIAELLERLAVPDFYTTDAAGFNQASADLQKAQAALAAAEDEWLELEILREAAGG